MKCKIQYAGNHIEYELIRTARKSMEIRVLSSSEVRVFAPERARLREIDAFVASRAEWIEEALRAMEKYLKVHAEAHPMHSGAEILFEGIPLSMEVFRAEKTDILRTESALIVKTPDTSENAVREAVRSYLFDCAGKRIFERVQHYAPLIGRMPMHITIRDQKTRWGSCSNKHNLNFNYKLIMAPSEALDYVVIHELCHLYDFNHSPAFWARVESHQRDYAVWRHWLKEHGGILGV